MYYPGLRDPKFDGCREFVVERLINLREGLAKEIPNKHLEGNVIIGSWNIRDFGARKLNPEPRLPESHYYIAEIISNFDILAVQEINENLYDFQKVMRLLDHDYEYLLTDVAEVDGGNQERIGFIYDKRKVSFKNIAGEIVLPQKLYEGEQFSRTPFVVSFQSGWFKFDLCSSHLYYGESSGPKYERRLREIKNIAGFMQTRAKKNEANTFILGDFNVEGPGKATWEALRKSDFTIPEEIATLKTNYGKTQHYDQIAFHSVRKEVALDEERPAGMFEFFKYVYRDEDGGEYCKDGRVKKLGKDFRKWATWQISDHFPIWVQLKTDFTDTYLKTLTKPSNPLSI